MKKLFIALVTLFAMLSFVSCKCTSDNTVPAEASLNVENTVSVAREYMYLHYGENYRWYETTVLLKDFIDEENDGAIQEITSVFQFAEELEEEAYDTKVVMFTNTETSSSMEIYDTFWVGDCVLNAEAIVLSFEEAYNRVMESNFVKPHSRYCVLRKELGPLVCNPQYVFGNVRSQLYVDAVTGEVRDYNPAFEGFKLPAVEWP